MADSNLSLGITIGASVAPSVGQAFESVEQRTQRVGSALRQTWSQRDVAANVIHYRDTLQQLKQKQAQLGYSSDRLNQGIAEVERRYSEAKAKAKQYGLSVGNIASEHRQLADSAAVAERRLGRLQTMQANQDKREQLQGEMMGTAGAALAAAAPIRAAMQFEERMADVKKVVDFEKPEQFEAMGQDILKMSGKMPMAASGIADIVAAAGQSGVARSELQEFAQSAVKMGTAFDMTGKQAGKMMADWRAGMGLTQEKTVSLADAVNHLSNNMNAEADALGMVIQREGATAKAAGLAAEETAALGSALLSSGTEPERAATAMKGLTSALTVGAAATKSQQQAFKALGTDSVTLAKRMQEDAQGTIVDVFERIKGLSKDKQLSIVKQIFGEDSKSAIMPLIGELENLRKSFGLVSSESKYAGSMQAEYEEREETTTAQMEIFTGKVRVLGVTLGSVLLPALNSTMDVVGDGVETVTDLAEQFPMLTQVVVGAGVGLAAFKVSALAGRYAATFLSDGVQLGKAAFDLLRPSTLRATVSLWRYRASTFASAAGSRALAVWTGMKGLGGSLWRLAARAIPRAVTGLRTLTIALMTNPIGAIVGGIALAAGLIYTYWEPISAFFGRLWAGITQVFTAAWEGFKTYLSWSPLSLLMKAWDPLTEWFGVFWKGIKSVFSGAYEWIKKVLLSTIKFVTNQIGKAWDTVKGWFGGGEEEKTVKVKEKLEKACEGAGEVGKTAAAATAAGASASAPAAAAPQAATQQPAAQTAQGAAKVVTIERLEAPITVQAAPGQDPEEIADLVVEQLEQKTRQVAADG